MKGQFMLIASIVIGLILIGTASSIAEVRSQNIEPVFARHDIDLIKKQASETAMNNNDERSAFKNYVESMNNYDSTIKYWSSNNCFNITLKDEESEYKLSCVGNQTAGSVTALLMEFTSLSDFNNKGSYSELGAERNDNSGILGLGYQNGNPSDNMKAFWRMDKTTSSYSVSQLSTYNQFWMPGSAPDFNIHSIQSDLSYQSSSTTTVTVNASNSGMGTWRPTVNLYNYSKSSVSWSSNDIGDSSGAIESIIPADIDHDGDTDLIYPVDGGDEQIEIAENQGGSWSTTVVGSQHAESASVGDIDGDGDLDIVSGGNNGNIYFWENDNGDASSWTQHTIGDDGSNNVRSVSLGDADGDGDLDIVSGSYSHNVLLWENDGTDSGWSNTNIGSGGRWTVTFANIDGDDDLDILSGHINGDVDWWENTGSGWSNNEIASESDEIFSLAVADYDDDGDLDVFAGSEGGNNDIYLYRNDGGSWSRTTIDSRDTGVRSLQVADIDMDGDKDLISGGNMNGGTDRPVEWHENDGTFGTWEGTPIGNQGDTGHYGIAVADLTGDGILDIATGEDTNTGTADLRVWETNGISTTFIGSDKISFTDENGGAKDATITWTPTGFNYNLLATVDETNNYTEVYETNDENAGKLNNYVLQSISASGTVKDYSGNGNDALSQNFDGDERGATGVFSTNGFEFDGNEEYVEYDGLLGYPQEFTLSTWVKIDSQDSDRPGEWADFFALGDYVLISSRESGFGDGITGFYHHSGGWRATTYSSSDLEGTGWHHIAYTNDGSEQHLYIDGVQEASTSYTEDVLWDGSLGNKTRLGGNGYHNDRDLEGSMDEAMFFKRALSESEVKELYFNGDSGDFRGTYNANSENLIPSHELSTLGVDASIPANTDGEVVVSHSSGSSQIIPISDGLNNYTISLPDTGGSASAEVRLNSTDLQTTPTVEELKIWTNN